MLISCLILLSAVVNGGAATLSAAPVPAILYPGFSVPQWQLNGIELGDTAGEVRRIWGKPAVIAPDEWQNECQTWSYGEGRNVGMCGGEVAYVQVMAEARKATLDGRELGMTDKELREALGRPDFEAEDGWGIVKGAEAIKVFVDERGNLVSMDLFTDSCHIYNEFTDVVFH